MNGIINDYGKSVVAIGAPNSIARAACRWPKLIDRLQSLFMQQYRIDSAIEEIRLNGIREDWETLAILENTYFISDPIYGIAKNVSRGPNDI